LVPGDSRISASHRAMKSGLKHESLAPCLKKSVLLLLVAASCVTLVQGWSLSKNVDALRNAILIVGHPWSDEPGDAPKDCITPIVGEHFFGDFQSEYCRLIKNDVYADTNDSDVTPPSRQFPSYFLFLAPFMVFGDVSGAFWSALITVGVLVATATSRLRVNLSSYWPAMLPAAMAIYRGNLMWIVASVFIMIWAIKKDSPSGWVWIALAAMIKPHLLLFSTWYLYSREVRRFALVIGFFVLGQYVSASILFSDVPVVLGILQQTLFGGSVLLSSDFRLGIRSDIAVLIALFDNIVDFSNYATANEVPAPVEIKHWYATVPVAVILLFFVFIVSTSRPRRLIAESQFASFLALVSSLCVLVAGPSFYYSLLPLAICMIASRQLLVVRFLTTLALLPLLIPIPIASRSKLDLHEYSSYSEFGWQSWTFFSVLSALALVLIATICARTIVKPDHNLE